MAITINITAMDGSTFELSFNSIRQMIQKFKEETGISFHFVDLFYEDIHMTTSLKIFRENIRDGMELSMVVDEKPVRLLQEDINKMKHFDSLTGPNDYRSLYSSVENKFGKIEEWDVSWIENMEYLFYNLEHFDKNINIWDTSSVVSMRKMFYGCKNFNQPLGKWNVEKVKFMDGMFMNCRKFNQDISGWKTNSLIE